MELEIVNEKFYDRLNTSKYDKVTHEFQVMAYYHDGSWNICDKSFSSLSEALDVAKSWYNEDRDSTTHMEIYVEVTGWKDGVPETISDAYLCYYKEDGVYSTK